jgi:cytochrome c peroxidase
MRVWIYSLVIVLLAVSACRNSFEFNEQAVSLKYPSWFPKPEIPADNMPTNLRIELGRRMFYSTAFSSDESVSCASCHALSAAFTDGKTVSTGVHGRPGKRNAPTLANLAWMPHFMMEGGVPSLELQALAPIADSNEMNLDILQVATRLNQDDYLRELSLAAYDREIDPYVITRALAAFQRTFISGDSPYDRYEFQGKTDQLTDAQIRGRALFFSRQTKCGGCHTDPFLTDFDFHNIGLYENYADPGRERVTYDPADAGKFKTPTLRNVALTAPYMHDGSMNTLEEVVRFYNEGGKDHPNKDFRVQPIGLTPEEEADLVAFLESLTDWNFVQNANLLPLEK